MRDSHTAMEGEGPLLYFTPCLGNITAYDMLGLWNVVVTPYQSKRYSPGRTMCQ